MDEKAAILQASGTASLAVVTGAQFVT